MTRELVERVACDMCGNWRIIEVGAEAKVSDENTLTEVTFMWDGQTFVMDVDSKCRSTLSTNAVGALIEKARMVKGKIKPRPKKGTAKSDFPCKVEGCKGGGNTERGLRAHHTRNHPGVTLRMAS